LFDQGKVVSLSNIDRLIIRQKKGQRFAEAVEKAGDLMLTIKAH
jgi:hypothetical protein